MTWVAIFVILFDNLYEWHIVASLIRARAHITDRLDQYLLAVIRGVASGIIAFFTICCGAHIAVRRTDAQLARYAVAGFFISSALVLLVVAYICEADYMAVGWPDILRATHTNEGLVAAVN